mgnify:CR=1 FL=1
MRKNEDNKNIAVIYWSNSENTEIMAEKISNGIDETGQKADLYNVSQFPIERIEDYDKVALGCPSMDGEALEKNTFEPFFEEIESKLKGKKVALFGSYGWGDGEWMRSWESRCNDDGANLACESVICNEAPDDDALAACRELGASLA